MVNTCNAGAGALAVTVEGPSKVKLECKEVDEGYEFTYNPTAPGDYMITIRYAGVNIAGSPFKAKIEGRFLYNLIYMYMYKFTYNSTSPGDYMITIRYAGKGKTITRVNGNVSFFAGKCLQNF